MNEQTTIEFIKNLPQIIGAFGIILAAYWAYKAKTQGTQNAAAIEVVRTDVNNKMQQLVETTARASKAEGKKEEAGEQAVREQAALPVKVEIVESPVAVKVVEDREEPKV